MTANMITYTYACSKSYSEGCAPMFWPLQILKALSGSPYKTYIHILAMYHQVRKFGKEFILGICEKSDISYIYKPAGPSNIPIHSRLSWKSFTVG